MLTVTVRDRFGNLTPDVRVTVAVHGGTMDGELVTDGQGRATAEVIWETQPPDGSVTVTAGGTPPVVIQRAAAPQQSSGARRSETRHGDLPRESCHSSTRMIGLSITCA
jgi:hypothetical protein